MPLSSLVPWWVRLFPLAVAFVGLPIAYAGTALALRLTRPPAPVPDEPWYERARVLRPAFVTARAALLFPFAFAVAAALLHGPASTVPAWLGVLVAFSVSAAGAMAATHWFFASVGAPRPLGARLRGLGVFLCVSTSFIWLAALGVTATEVQAPGRYALLAGLALAVMVAAAGGGLFLARAMGLARPPRPALVDALARASEASGARPRWVYEVDLSHANAFAIPWFRAVGVAPRLIELTTPEELVAVLRHELGHLEEPLGVRLHRLATPLAAGWLVLFEPWLLRSGSYWTLLVLAILLLGVALLLHRRSATLEQQADTSLGADHAAFAAALEKIYQDGLVPAVIGGHRNTHPELYDRMVAAGHPPSWPRPDPPPRRRGPLLALVATMLLPFALMLWASGDALEPRSELAVALSGGERAKLYGLARHRLDEGRREDARGLLLALAAAEDSEFGYSSTAGLLAEAGYCAEAQQLAAVHQLLIEESRWQRWVAARLRRCEEGVVSGPG